MTSLARKTEVKQEPIFPVATWVHRPEYVLYFSRPGFPPKRQLKGFKKIRPPERIWPLDQLRVAGTHEIPCDSGIYFLWRGPQLLYIGQTFNLYHRIYQHERNRDGFTTSHKRIPFTHCTFIFCDSDCREKIESEYIRAYLPPYNDKV